MATPRGARPSVAIDTNFIIDIERSENERHERAKEVLDYLLPRARILMPTLVLAEHLAGHVDVEAGNFGNRQALQERIQALQKLNFITASMTEATTPAIAYVTRLALQERDREKDDRHVVKADAAIVGTALSLNAALFVASDNQCASIAVRAGLHCINLNDPADWKLGIPKSLED